MTDIISTLSGHAILFTHTFTDKKHHLMMILIYTLYSRITWQRKGE